MAKKTEIPKGELNRVDRLVANLAFSAMSEMLLLPKKIDELKKLPAYVKDGEVFDFNDRSFGETYKPDGEIFDVARVLKTQAVTQALKTAYTKALTEWMEVSEDEASEGKKPKKVNAVEDNNSPSDLDIDAEVSEGDASFLDDVKALLEEGKFKKANKLIKDNPDHPKAKKAKKLYKKAKEA